MSGLSLTLKPREKFLVGGNLVENGPRRSSIRIVDDGVYVLRLSDAIHPNQVTTPVRRAYHAAQQVLACVITPDEGFAELSTRLQELTPIFERAGEHRLMARITSALVAGRYYGVLVGLRSLLDIENKLLSDVVEVESMLFDSDSEFAECIALGRR